MRVIERERLMKTVVAVTVRSITLALLTFLLPVSVPGQTKKPPSNQDVKIYQEARGWFQKAEAMIGTPKENSDEQADLFKKVIDIKSDFIEAHFNLGLIYTAQNKPKEALRYFENVRRLNPDFEGIYQLLASTYRDLGQIDEAVSALKEGLKKQPNSLKILRPLAYLQLHGEDESAAIPTFLTILDVDPKDSDTRLNLGILYQKRNRYEEAVRCYQQVLEAEPANFTARYNLALVLLRQKKVEDATAEMELANKLSPGNAELLERLGDVYSYQNHHDKAAAAYQAAIGKGVARADLFSKLGFSLATLKRNSEAAVALEKSVTFNPNNPDAYYMLGDLYSELKRYDESVSAYQTSLKLNPAQKEVHYNLGTLYAERKQYEEARAELKAAVDLDPNYAPAWSNLAVVYEKLDLAKEAIQANERVVALGQAQAATFFRLGLLYAKSNLPDPSIANFSKAIQQEPDKYRQLLREELKNVHSVLDSVRYKDAFVRLLTERQ
jgi:tetratricopeptide (TPR) repeat protein